MIIQRGRSKTAVTILGERLRPLMKYLEFDIIKSHGFAQTDQDILSEFLNISFEFYIKYHNYQK